MRYFFSYIIDGDQLILEGEEAKHCVKVLRKKTGDQIQVLDGLGHLFTAEIVDIRRNACIADIKDKQVMPTGRDWELTLAISPLKNPSRLEWCIEKTTELGVDRIVPLLCKRTEKPSVKSARLINILISAMKQSGQYRLPRLGQVTSFSDFMVENTVQNQQGLIAYCELPLPHITSILKPKMDITILIGPEGDFTPDEFEQAIGAGYAGISLGQNRLRTETAGIFACSAVHAYHQI